MSEVELRGQAVIPRTAPFSPATDEPIVADDVARLVGGALPSYADPEAPGWARRVLNFIFSLWPSLILFVVVPTAALAIYYGFIAADQFVVEWKFVVRQVQDTSFSKGGTTFDTEQGGGDSEILSQGSGKSSSGMAGSKSPSSGSSSRSSSITIDNQDGYVVASYIQSAAILRDLAKKVDLRQLFSRPEADFSARLGKDATTDELTAYWLDHVDAYVDRPSGIVTVDFRAFRRRDVLTIADAVDGLATNLVNDISLRARQEALARARQEVERSDKAMGTIMADFEAFRDRAGLIDPNNTATATGDLLKQLLSERIATDSRLSVLRQLRPGAPEIGTLKTQLQSIDRHLAELRATLTAKEQDAGTVAAALAKFEELQVKEQLAEQLYIDARNDEERARQTAEKRWLYIATFQPPVLPDDAEYPDRLGFTAIGAIMLFVGWSIVALIRMSILDHRI